MRKIIAILFFVFMTSNCLAYSKVINGLKFIDARTDVMGSKYLRYQLTVLTNKKHGDFQGNGGDPLRLRYGIIFNYLRELNFSHVEGVLPANVIYSYQATTFEENIILLDDSIYIPEKLYFDQRVLKNVVDSLFHLQLINIDRFDNPGGESFFFNPTRALDESIKPGGVTDLKERVRKVFRDMNIFLNEASFKKTEKVKHLELVDFNLVDNKVYDNEGARVCGIYLKHYEVQLSSSCWSRMSVMEQRLILVHEIFRFLNLDDDDYSLTYQFHKYIKYSEVTSFDPY